jgi:hypothetical protein
MRRRRLRSAILGCEPILGGLADNFSVWLHTIPGRKTQ